MTQCDRQLGGPEEAKAVETDRTVAGPKNSWWIRAFGTFRLLSLRPGAGAGDELRARLVDFEMAAVDIFNEDLLMAPVSAIPRLLARHGLKFNDIDIADHRDPLCIGCGVLVENIWRA
jgi:acetyl-CoA acetyltransferase